ncbi:hypothetical protein CC78DRAFT_11585 [Lojkania enalia]|uniref:Uncharacterized protein n=1 Tax=Lojkania enalia TaxID=147567 RepID=A0A9P4ND88_9PLEO|nr:hypothetical protein CC78DRAFT_11585 [Didymosphaeria enalia]
MLRTHTTERAKARIRTGLTPSDIAMLLSFLILSCHTDVPGNINKNSLSILCGNALFGRICISPSRSYVRPQKLAALIILFPPSPKRK